MTLEEARRGSALSILFADLLHMITHRRLHSPARGRLSYIPHDMERLILLGLPVDLESEIHSFFDACCTTYSEENGMLMAQAHGTSEGVPDDLPDIMQPRAF